MCLKLDNIFFVELVWILTMIGIIVSSWYTLVGGIAYPSNPAILFGLNVNMVFLFLFAILLWGLFNIRYPKEIPKKKKPKRR